MPDLLYILKQKSLVIILAYAPTGLGHLRVTDALYDGLPIGSAPLLLGAHDHRLTYIHRLGSIHPLTRKFTEWLQNGWAEDLFYNGLYVRYLQDHAESLYKQMVTILEQRIDLPRTVLVVSTHFGLTHQLAQIKEKLAKDLHVRIILVVVVTDDSPQHIWYTEGADLTFVPSELTKSKLIQYAKDHRLRPTHIEVVSYPVSPLLSQQLTESEWLSKKKEVDPKTQDAIHVSLPVSGAAVGLDYFTDFVDTLNQLSLRFRFHTVAKIAPYTQNFINEMLTRSYMTLYTSTHDRELVDKYIELYQKEVIALEITKPSEQAFKALLTPKTRGGSILLFSSPVGRQEYDNLHFLRRHHLLPTQAETQVLHKRSVSSNSLSDDQEGKRLLEEAQNWRGIELPEEPKSAAACLWWLLREKIFIKMLTCQIHPRGDDRHAHELSPHGVETIWERLSAYLGNLPP